MKRSIRFAMTLAALGVGLAVATSHSQDLRSKTEI